VLDRLATELASGRKRRLVERAEVGRFLAAHRVD
jgi:hypothetical protein